MGLRGRKIAVAVAVLMALPLAGGGRPAAAVDADVTVVRLSAAPAQRPGPDILYAPPARAPQLENTGVWQAAPLMVSGSSAYRGGEFLYQDYVYDDLGTYPAGPEYTQNDADLVEVRLKPLAEALAVRLTFQSMRTPDITGTTISLGASAEPREMPHGANTSTSAEVFVTVHGSTAEVVDAATGAPVAQHGVTVRVDLLRRHVKVRIPYDVYDPRGKSDVQVGTASGVWDRDSGTYVAQGPGDRSAFLNAAFRYAENGNWFASDQQAALSAGDLSGLVAHVNFAKLAAGTDDDLSGTEEGAPTSGIIARLYASHFEEAQGRGQANVPKSAVPGGGQPTPENCPDGCILPYPNQLQPYAIYVPSTPPPASGYGLTIDLHGANGNYTSLAGTTRVRQLGDRSTGSIILLPHERGEENTYYGLAEADTFEAWADINRNYPLDPSLTAVTGASMGGVGTYKYAVEYPDLFARAAPVIGYTYSWVGYTGPPDGQHTTSRGEYNLFYSALDSLRHVPVMSWNGATDELVQYKAVRPIIDRLDGLGYRYDHLIFGTEHFSTGLSSEQDSQLIADFLGDARVVENPAHVTYVKNSNFQDPRYSLNPDHAYWVSGITAGQPATVPDEYGSAATFSHVDVFSHGFGVADQAQLATATGAGVHSVAGPYTRQTKSWADEIPSAPVADRLDISARNTSTITIDTARARVSCDPELNVTADGPITIVLAGCGALSQACPPDQVPTAGYDDVSRLSAHAHAIDCLTWWGVATGKSASRYDPNGNVTRGQVASFVARTIEQAGVPLTAAGDHFRDDDGTTHEQAINKLATAGVVSGKTPGRFAPRAAISRAQMATILARVYELAANKTLEPGTDAFDDDNDSTHQASINKLAAVGIVTGTGGRTYAPAATVNRAQMASFLARVLDRLVSDGKATPPTR